MTETVKLELHIQDVNILLSTLGQTPTNSGVYPLMMGIRQQAEIYIALQKQQMTQPKVEVAATSELPKTTEHDG